MKFIISLLYLLFCFEVAAQSARPIYVDDINPNSPTGSVNIVNGLTIENSAVSINDILDEDTMASDSDTAIATQQSIKAYVDSVATATPNVSSATGVLSTQNGGTGVAQTLTGSAFIISNGDGEMVEATPLGAPGEFLAGPNLNVTSIQATANQTVVTSATGAITLGTIQDINVTSEPTFSGVYVDTLRNNSSDTISVTGNLDVQAGLSAQGIFVTNGTPTGVLYFRDDNALHAKDTFTFIDSNDYLGLGKTSTPTSRFNLAGTNGEDVVVDVEAYSGTASDFPSFRLSRSRGTQSSPAVVLTDDILGKLDFQSWNSAQFKEASSIHSYATQDYSVTNGGADLRFYTAPKSLGSPTLALTINDDQTSDFKGHIQAPSQTIGVGTISPSAIFHIYSTSQGSIPFPMMTQVERDAIASPVEGLHIWNTDTQQTNSYDGSTWNIVADTGSSDLLSGTPTALYYADTSITGIADDTIIAIDTTTKELSVAGGYNDSSFSGDRQLFSNGAHITEATSLGTGEFLAGPGVNVTTIAATANQTTFTSATGIMTIGTVQDIEITSSPTFAGMTLTGLNASEYLITDSSGVISSTGQLDASDLFNVVPIVNGGTNSSTALNNNRIMISSGDSIVEATSLGTGEFLAGPGVNVTTIAATANQTTFTSATGIMTIGTVQDINTNSVVQFSEASLTGALLVGNGTLTPSALFQIVSGTKGSVPFPKMTEASRDGIANPTEGLTVWNLDTNQLNNFDGTSWTAVAGSGSGGSSGLTGTPTGIYYADTSTTGIADSTLFSVNTSTGEFSAVGGYNDSSFAGQSILFSSGSKIKEATALGNGEYLSTFSGNVTVQSFTGTNDQLVVSVTDGDTNFTLADDINNVNSISLDSYVEISSSGVGTVANPSGANRRLFFKDDGNLYAKNSAGNEKLFTSGTVNADVCYVLDVQSAGTAGGSPGGSGSYTTVTRDLNTTTGTCGHVELSANQITLTPSGSFCLEAETACYDSDITTAYLFNTTTNTVTGLYDYPVNTFCSGATGTFGTQATGNMIETKSCFTIASPEVIELRWHGKESDDIASHTLGIPRGTYISDATATGEWEIHSRVKVIKYE